MTLDTLIELLSEYRDELGGDVEVRLMTQQNQPFENHICGLTSGQEMNDTTDDSRRSKRPREGDHGGKRNDRRERTLTVETIGSDASTAVAVPKRLRKTKAAETIAGEKKLSAVAAALKVLGESTEPMAC